MNVHQLCISPSGGPRRRVRGHKRLDSSSSSSSNSSTTTTSSTTTSSSSSSSSADDQPVAVKCARLSVVTETTRGGGGGGDARQVVAAAAAAAAAAAVLGSSSSSPPGSPTTTTAPTTATTTTTTTVPDTTVPHAAAAASVTPHPGPSRIGPFLLLPALADRDGVHSALNTDTGDELVCKVFDMAVYQEKIRGYSALPPHVNVAAVRDIVLGERRAYVFWDPQHGDLHALVRSRRRLDEGHARALFRQAARAVAHCHRAGVVLGDLKLRKFVFADEKRTKVRLESLEDCRVLEDPRCDAMSDTHGCPAYVSPEILSGSAPYSGKMADVWSLGVMLYTMLVGRYPFHDPDPATLFSKIRRGQCCLPEGLSPGARCLLQSLLRKEPAERLTAAELLAHPWFHRPLPPSSSSSLSSSSSSSQEATSGEQEAGAADQAVPSFDVEDDEDLFC